MAITFVGSYASSHAATSAQTVAFTNLRNESNAQPTLLPDDWVYVAVENASTLNRSTAGGADVLVPAGYTGLGTHDYRDDSNDSNFRVSRKKMGATPDASVAIPASNATTAGVAYVISVWRGVDPTSPESVAVVTAGAANTGIANGAAITPAHAGSVILVFAGAAVAAGVVFTNPAGMSTTTNHFRSATITSTTNDANIAVAVKTDWVSGAFDPAAFGGSTSTNTGSWSAVTVALRPFVSAVQHQGAFVASGTGSLAAAGRRQHNAAFAATGSGTQAASGAMTFGGRLAAAGAGALAATGRWAAGARVAFSGAGTQSAAGRLAAMAKTAVSGTGSLVASGSKIFTAMLLSTGSGSVTMRPQLTARSSLDADGGGTLSAQGEIVGQEPADNCPCVTPVRGLRMGKMGM
jgi:hypothetical protein